MGIFIDLEMNLTDPRLIRKKDLRNEIIEIGAVRMDEHFHPLDRFRIFVRPQYNGVIERSIYKLTGISNALHRAGLEPEGSLHDASWDAYNSARLMETAYSEDFAVDLANAQDACYQEAPKIQGGLPLDVMMKLAALLQPEPCAAV